jgi:hypothetical protein
MKRLVVVLALAGFASTVCAQSLGDVAKKTEEERDKTKTSSASSPTASKKTYSDKDLKEARPVLTDTPAEKQPAAVSPDKAPATTASSKPENTASDKAKSVAKDEAYWRARWTPIQQTLNEKLARSAQLKARIAKLTSELSGSGVSNARRAGVESERQRLIAMSDTLDVDISGDKAALADIQEEGRRAGALPGWFR